ncbi:MAG: AsmA-like C-terminal region-containing protein, partial [Armatimonadetes bacterium]|nr:AsmA-like C-terminal region-containing protein [Armatimonadota bacterium]
MADPSAVVDLGNESLTVAGQPLRVGRARATYEGGQLAIDEASFDMAGGRVTIEGGYGEGMGFSVEVVGDDLDLGGLTDAWRSRLGLALTGDLTVRARVTGPASQLRLAFGATAGPLSVNEVDLDELVVAGQFGDGVLRIDTGVLRRGAGVVSVSGELGLREKAVDAVLEVEQVRLDTVMGIGDRAVWRLYRAGMRSPYFKSYSRVPRPLRGMVTAKVRAVGRLAEPEVSVSFGLEDVGFNGRSVEHIGGDVSARLRMDGIRGVSLENAEIDLEATHDIARASLTGDVSVDGEANLQLDVGNLDLRLLGPWLEYSFELGGMATVNFDITGPIKQPVVRGDVFVDELKVGGLSLEAVAASPIRIQRGVLSL